MQINMFAISLCLLALLGCGPENSTKDVSVNANRSISEEPKERVRLINRITSPTSKDKFKQGDNIALKFNATSSYDSAVVTIDGRRVDIDLNKDSGTIKSDSSWPVGKRKVEVTLYEDGASQSRSVSFMMLPNQGPTHHKARVVTTLPHNPGSYTQGFEFNDGYLLESSGQYGISYLAEIEFPSMKERRRIDIDPKLFAEGITVMNDKIYMLSWQEGVGLIFDRGTLKQIDQWSYSTEGWGITNDGKRLYMSDGSNYIYIIDPATMKSLSKLEVVTPKGEVNYLNELEWIDGKIWANIYGSTLIVIINPNTGVVEKVVDCSEIRANVSGDIDVLNGIALDDTTGKVYLTGKLWPKSFEIAIEPAI